jgi:hypothetical protein
MRIVAVNLMMALLIPGYRRRRTEDSQSTSNECVEK